MGGAQAWFSQWIQVMQVHFLACANVLPFSGIIFSPDLMPTHPLVLSSGGPSSRKTSLMSLTWED